jgi:[citrate (pro-3S)-lyase] ligase
MFDTYELRIYTNPDASVRSRVAALLERENLVFEGDPQVTVCLEDEDGNVYATASLDGKIIKMVAVDTSLQEGGYSSKVISGVISQARQKGQTSLFVFTKTGTAERFLSFGFQEIARYDPVALLEMGEPGIRSYRQMLRQHRVELPEGKNVAGGVVVNCNPFTRGHRYLIEEAASRCDHLYVVVVQADLSLFPFAHRIDLVRRGTEDLGNVTVLPSGDYAVSPATFPAYFLRDADSMKKAHIQASLDVTLFANLFGEELGLTRRFVGTEPYCPVTRQYNDAMKAVLPSREIELVEIPRKEEAGSAISASTVRQLIREDRWEELHTLVPPVTWEYLRDPERADIIRKIKETESRH